MPKVDFKNVPRLTIDKLNNEGCLKLLETFLAYTAEDYTMALRTWLRDKSDKDNYTHYLSIRNFFLSDYFANLTSLDGEAIVSRLDAQVLGRNCPTYAGSY